MPLEFEIIGPNEYGRIVPIREGIGYLGRQPTCEYHFTCIGVAREAVKIESDGIKITVTGLYNRCEVSVNNQSFENEATAYPGDIVHYRQFRLKIRNPSTDADSAEICRKTPDSQLHTQYSTLFESILANPTDDAPRYALADWLDANEFKEYASFIRQQLSAPDRLFHILSANLSFEFASLCCEILRPWITQIPNSSHWKFRRGLVSDIDLKSSEFMKHAKELFSTFPIENVRLSWVSPIRQSRNPEGQENYVWETDQTSIELGEQVTNKLPIEIIERMSNFNNSRSTYQTSEDAFIALSTACVAYGKSL